MLAETAAATTNAPEWSVSDLAQALRRTLEDNFGHVRLRGEISGYRGPHGSGHVYFSLKDDDACIDAVIWRSAFSRLRFRPQEGLEVIATGRITTFAGKSKYQIVIDSLEPAGVGALMALLDERRRKLAAEGLFEAARKQPLPFIPRVIGVVTSPTGAVIRDILHRLADRFPRRVLVWPVRVQGETSAEEVAAAIRGFNALAPDGAIPRPDVIIVARGGGSLEDLWSFNEEIVVRAAAESAIPLVSAVGHETDTTLDRPRRRPARADPDRRGRDGGAGLGRPPAQRCGARSAAARLHAQGARASPHGAALGRARFADDRTGCSGRSASGVDLAGAAEAGARPARTAARDESRAPCAVTPAPFAGRAAARGRAPASRPGAATARRRLLRRAGRRASASACRASPTASSRPLRSSSSAASERLGGAGPASRELELQIGAGARLRARPRRRRHAHPPRRRRRRRAQRSRSSSPTAPSAPPPRAG